MIKVLKSDTKSNRKNLNKKKMINFVYKNGQESFLGQFKRINTGFCFLNFLREAVPKLYGLILGTINCAVHGGFLFYGSNCWY